MIIMQLMHPNGLLYHQAYYSDNAPPMGPFPVNREGRYFLSAEYVIDPPWICRVSRDGQEWSILAYCDESGQWIQELPS